jgi:UDPglucose 6-dehydrogenase
MHPGPGFGGSCFPKDTKALVKIAESHDIEMKVIKATIEANESQHLVMVEKIKKVMAPLRRKTLAVLGLSFKLNTDDIREAPSIYIIKKLIKEGAKIRAHDPAAMKNAKKVLPEVSYFKDPYTTIKGADALIIVTEWNEFRNLELERIRKLLKMPYFFDLKNLYDPQRVRKLGFEYFCVGRPTNGQSS